MTRLILGPCSSVSSLSCWVTASGAVVWPGQRSERVTTASSPLLVLWHGSDSDPSRAPAGAALLSLCLHLRPCPASIPAPCRIDLVEPESVEFVIQIQKKAAGLASEAEAHQPVSQGRLGCGGRSPPRYGLFPTRFRVPPL